MRNIAIISDEVKDMDVTAARIQTKFPELSLREVSDDRYRSIHILAPDDFNRIFLVVSILKSAVDSKSWSDGFDKGFKSAMGHVKEALV